MGLFDIMNDLDQVFNRQTGQAFTAATTLEIWNNSVTSKSEAWLFDQSPSTLETAITQTLPTYVAKDDVADFSDWLQMATSANQTPNWSLAMVMQVQTLIVQAASKGTGNQQQWNGLSGVIGPFNNYINSAMTQDTTVGNAEVQTTQGDIDQLNTAPQAYADAGASYDQFLSSIANSMASAA